MFHVEQSGLIHKLSTGNPELSTGFPELSTKLSTKIIARICAYVYARVCVRTHTHMCVRVRVCAPARVLETRY